MGRLAFSAVANPGLPTTPSGVDAISIPKVMPPLHETPWLIAYAGEKGMGLSPGQSAWDMLGDALAQGGEETKLAAMYIFRIKPDEADPVVETLISLMNERQDEVSEAAYQTLWQLNSNSLGII